MDVVKGIEKVTSTYQEIFVVAVHHWIINQLGNFWYQFPDNNEENQELRFDTLVFNISTSFQIVFTLAITLFQIVEVIKSQLFWVGKLE